MRITLLEAIESQPALQSLSTISFKPVLGWKIGKVKAKVDKEVSLFQAVRVKIIEGYGAPVETGGFQVPQEKLEEFNLQIGELLNEEIEINSKPIGIDELGEKEIPASVFSSLPWMFSQLPPHK